jgi:undecaprenyl-phosphate galactose phosphotransferase
MKRRSMLEETRALVKSASIASAFTLLVLTFTRTEQIYSRWVIVLAWAFSLVLLPVSRNLVKTALFHANLWKKRVIIIGSTDSMESVVRSIGQNHILGYQIVGCLTDDRSLIDSAVGGVTVLGHHDDIEMWQKRTQFEDIIVAFPDIPADRLIELIRRWDGVAETIRYIPRTGELITSGVEIENLGRILSLTIRKNLHKPWNVLIKSFFDLILSVILLVLLLPVGILIAAAVRFDSPGPAFFTQTRYGKRGRLIRVIKFRSMHQDADARLEAFLRDNAAAREEWAHFKKLRNGDPRVTKVGAFLRRHSLDELPQLFNVLAGRMSLVGPRPYIQEELVEVKQMRSILFQTRPGITGLWQIGGRSNVSFADRLKIDESYIRNWTLWTDVLILFKTIGAIVSGRGAF